MASPDREAAVLVVGGGPAGLATASALAGKGVDVSVVERSDYRDIRIGEHIAPAAVHDLRAMGFPASDGEDAHLRSSGVDAWWGGSTASHMDYLFHPAGRGFNLSRPFSMRRSPTNVVRTERRFLRRRAWCVPIGSGIVGWSS